MQKLTKTKTNSKNKLSKHFVKNEQKPYLLDNGSRKKILLDTNFLLTMIRYKIHGFEEMKNKYPCDFFTLSRVLFELERLSKSDKKIKNETILVKKILQNNSVRVIDSTKEDVDAELVEKSKEGFIIATNDKLLRQKVKDAGGKTIYVRSLSYIEMDEN